MGNFFLIMYGSSLVPRKSGLVSTVWGECERVVFVEQTLINIERTVDLCVSDDKVLLIR